VILCHCNVVTSSDVADAYEAGARTVSAVCRTTGAGRSCGACVFSVRQAVCEHVAERPPAVGAVFQEAPLAAS
jgi:NAD(P)H-nitrite reductase large subunit